MTDPQTLPPCRTCGGKPFRIAGRTGYSYVCRGTWCWGGPMRATEVDAAEEWRRVMGAR